MTQTKKKNSINKVEKFVLDRTSVSFFERTYNFWTGLLVKYNKYLQKRILQKYADELVETVIDHNLKPIYKQLLDNQIAQELTRLSMAGESLPKGLTGKQMLLASKTAIDTYSELESIIGIQPMSGPVGLIYTIEYADCETNTPVTNLHSGNKIGLKVISHAAESGSRRMSAGYSIEAMKDLNTVHGVDVAEEVTKALGWEVGHEQINEILDDLLRLAGTKRHFDFKTTAGPENAPAWVGDRYSHLAVTINEVCNEIARKTRRGSGNFIVVSPVIVSVLQSASKAVFAPAIERPGRPKNTYDLQWVGTLNGTIKVYSTLHESVRNGNILVGYKGGNGQADTGFVFSPYVTIIDGGMSVDPKTFEPQVRFITSYGKSIRANLVDGEMPLSHSANYYGAIKVTGLTSYDDEEKMEFELPEVVEETSEKTATTMSKVY